jgi:hypothetical protein
MGDIDWIDLTQDWNKGRALVNAILNLRVRENAGKFLIGCTTGGVSSSDHLHQVS